MGVVRHQPGIVSEREARQRGQRGEITVHRENAVGQDHGPAIRRPVSRKQCGKMVDVVVTEAEGVAAAELGARPQAGMSQLIDQNEVFVAEKRGDHPEIGEIAGAEHAGRLAPLEPGEAVLKLGIERVVAGDQAGGAGAKAVAHQRLVGGGKNRRVADEVEIVVARKREQPASVALDSDALHAGGAG